MNEPQVETTLYSMSEELPTPAERREAPRHLTLFRVGSCCIDGRHELCLVKNISAGGVLIRSYSDVAVGQEIEIELREGHPTTGRVSWIGCGDAGIEFDKPIDIPSLLSAHPDAPRQRMPRVEVNCIAYVREGAVVQRGTARNISQGGVSVETPKWLEVGAAVTVRMPGLEPRSGVVRWADSGRHGISFNTLLGLSDLVDWLHKQQG